MKYFLILMLLASTQAFGSNGSGNVSSVITTGSYTPSTGTTSSLTPNTVVTPITGTKVTLVASDGTGGASFYFAFSKQGAQGQYTTPANGTVCYHIRYGASAAGGVILGHAASITNNSATAPGTPVYYGISSTFESGSLRFTGGGSDTIPVDFGIQYVTFAGGKNPFVFLQTSQAFSMVMDCVELP